MLTDTQKRLLTKLLKNGFAAIKNPHSIDAAGLVSIGAIRLGELSTSDGTLTIATLHPAWGAHRIENTPVGRGPKPKGKMVDNIMRAIELTGSCQLRQRKGAQRDSVNFSVACRMMAHGMIKMEAADDPDHPHELRVFTLTKP
jgi:hypothetical protein